MTPDDNERLIGVEKHPLLPIYPRPAHLDKFIGQQPIPYHGRFTIIDPVKYQVYIGDDLLPLDTLIKEYQKQLEDLSQIMKWQTGEG